MSCKISVIIPCYCNEDRHDWSRLYLSLLGYANQSLSIEDFEIIIVDDGSQWDISKLVKNCRFNFTTKIIRQSHQGMCSAYQVGINCSQSDYILLGIDDNIPCATLLEEHLKDLKSNDSIVVWGREYHMRKIKNLFNPITGEPKNKFLTSQDSTKPNSYRIDKTDIFNNFEALRENSEITDKYQDIECFLGKPSSIFQSEAAWLTMRVGNQSLSRSLLDKAGGIDTAFDPSGWYMDLELGFRLVKQEARFKLNKNAFMIHLSHNRGNENLQDEEVKHHAFYSKHPYIEVGLVPLFFNSNLKIDEYFKVIKRIKNLNPKEAAYG